MRDAVHASPRFSLQEHYRGVARRHAFEFGSLGVRVVLGCSGLRDNGLGLFRFRV